MENASKALLMAGGILITMVVVSLGLYIMQNMAESSAHFYQIMEQAEVDKFNKKFTKYLNKDMTMQDVVSLMNLARDTNIKGEVDTSDLRYIHVTGESGTLISNISNYINLAYNRNAEYENATKTLIKSYTPYSTISTVDGTDKTKRIKYFTCEININSETGRVDEIEIKQIDNE